MCRIAHNVFYDPLKAISKMKSTIHVLITSSKRPRSIKLMFSILHLKNLRSTTRCRGLCTGVSHKTFIRNPVLRHTTKSTCRHNTSILMEKFRFRFTCVCINTRCLLHPMHKEWWHNLTWNKLCSSKIRHRLSPFLSFVV